MWKVFDVKDKGGIIFFFIIFYKYFKLIFVYYEYFFIKCINEIKIKIC